MITGLVILIGVGLFFLFRKKPIGGMPDGNSGGTCDALIEYNIKKEECHKKCAPNLAIPFVGIGYYKLCNMKCVAKLKEPVC